MSSVQRPSLLYMVYALICFFFVPWALIMWVDLMLHPWEMGTFFGGYALRLIIGGLIAPLNMITGLWLVRRAPRNVLPLFLIVIGAGWICNQARNTVDDPVVIALNYFVGGSIWFPLITVALFFPNGTAYPPRIAHMIDLVYAFVVGLSIPFGFVVSPSIDRFAFGGVTSVTLPNPFYIPQIAPLWSILQPLTMVSILFAFFYGAISLVLRYRAGNHRIRAQLRWLAWGFAVMLALTLFGLITDLFNYENPSPLIDIFNIVFYLWIFLFPFISITNAILRHRLYDIDIIIRRTLIYSALTAILAAVYFGAVILMQRLFRTATGETSDFGIVLSTLLIAALFSPLRHRIQDVIDRRLYRRKYDVEQTLAAFNRTLRDEVDVDSLKSDLIGVVNSTMQPDKVALWVKSEEAT